MDSVKCVWHGIRGVDEFFHGEIRVRVVLRVVVLWAMVKLNDWELYVYTTCMRLEMKVSSVGRALKRMMGWGLPWPQTARMWAFGLQVVSMRVPW